ncbi:type III PLP-dependent enzyme [Aquisphaera insulae]|uniref:type III PLP-dependent enzyme n=1 Tax=Aquisphaera insulae TaxID=2712864 RepID=UPI0013EDAF32|nr:type III PLP-dependent enzyme [Aquisphaera insulae]
MKESPVAGESGCIFPEIRGMETPLLLMDLRVVGRNVELLRNAFPDVDIWYALKSNPDERVVSCLATLGVGFEVASASELRAVLGLGIPSDRIVCLHTIKSPAFVRLLHDSGISVMAVDCREEVQKLATIAPRSRVVVRLETDGHGSRVRLGGKFGCAPDEVVELARLARRSGLESAGVTMHVGSQCEAIATWLGALNLCRAVCERLAEVGAPPEIISLGGGLPVPYTTSVPPLAAIGGLVRDAAIQRCGTAGCRVTFEPGRSIAATAGTLVTSVIGTATRGGERWVYLDAGIYQGLFEWLPAAGGFAMPIVADHGERPFQRCRLAGPTCDSLDVLPGEFNLPELRTGDRLAFRFAGAYSTSVSTTFNGFDPPRVVLVGTGGDSRDG